MNHMSPGDIIVNDSWSRSSNSCELREDDSRLPIDAAKGVNYSVVDHSKGLACSIIPIFGTVITEIQAVGILSGTDAVPRLA